MGSLRLPLVLFWSSCLASAVATGTGFRFLGSYPGSHLHMSVAILGGLLWLFACILSVRRVGKKLGLITLHLFFLAIFAGIGARFFGLPGVIHHWLVYILIVAQVHVTVRATLLSLKSVAP